MWYPFKKKVKKDSRETDRFYESLYDAEHLLKNAMKTIALVPNEDRIIARDILLRCRNQVSLMMDLCDVCPICHQIREDEE